MKHYYQKKGQIQSDLIDNLSVMLIERPKMMQYKKNHFFKSYEGGAANGIANGVEGGRLDK